ncbi:MerR family transcriptional regulator [Polymorphospora sp. NPDC050346]|uniref:DNA polymerase III subunit beta family protein n=1 Tax=Polymorphospora sp. NPDC050346 TaxID=3155780 RepID=UPI0033D031A8
MGGVREQDDRMTIGAFARATDVTTSALRFYDDCGLVRPDAVDPVTGYRYYSPDQIDEVVLIRQLRQAGLPLEDVRRLLTGPAEAAEELLAAHLRTLERAVEVARATATTALTLIRDRTGNVVTVPGRTLAHAIGQVAPAADTTGEIPVLGGVLIETTAGELRLIATDRYRLAARSITVRGRREPAAAVVAAPHLEDARPWIGAQASIRLRLADSHVRLDGPGGERLLPTIDGTYPSYRVVLDDPPEPLTRVVAPRERLLAALGDDPRARLDLLVGNGLTITSSAHDRPSVTVPADTTGEPVAISFRFTTLHPALSASVGPDVMLQITRPHRPVVVRSADDGDFTTLAMPVKATTPPAPQGEP